MLVRSVGVSVSTTIGMSVGASVGVSVATSVGKSVGASVGVSVGTSVGYSVGTSVGESVGTSVGNKVRCEAFLGWTLTMVKFAQSSGTTACKARRRSSEKALVFASDKVIPLTFCDAVIDYIIKRVRESNVRRGFQ